MKALLMSLLVLGFSADAVSAQSPDRPITSITVTLPDGQIKELTAPESGTAVFTLADGAQFGIRPTIIDSRPWTRVVLTVFKGATATQAWQEIGAVEVKTGAAPVQTKTTPAFKVAVTRVTPPSGEQALPPTRATQSH